MMVSAQGVPSVGVLGDSHSRFFVESRYFAGRMGFRSPLPFRIEGQAIHAASVAGFRPGVSTLDVKTRIREAVLSYDYLVLAFGQVDVELGYYYRLAVKGEKIDPEGYAAWLAGIYADFLQDLNLGGKRVALKGVNLTALRPRAFAVRYVSRIVAEGSELTPREKDRRVGPYLLTEIEQNSMHLLFNKTLRSVADGMGHEYFDLVNETSSGPNASLSVSTPVLKDEFLTAAFDHHLADTVLVRRMHFEAVGRVFGFTP